MNGYQLSELQKARKALNEHSEDIRAEWDKPLTFTPDGFVASGIFWIPSFTEPDPPHLKIKRKRRRSR